MHKKRRNQLRVNTETFDVVILSWCSRWFSWLFFNKTVELGVLSLCDVTWLPILPSLETAKEIWVNFISFLVCEPIQVTRYLRFRLYTSCTTPSFVFHFSWVLWPPQLKLKTRLMQNFRGQIRCIVGDVQVAYVHIIRYTFCADTWFRRDFYTGANLRQPDLEGGSSHFR